MIMKKNVVRALIPTGENNSLMMHDFHHLRDSLRFLANGKSHTSLIYYFKVGKAAVCRIVETVCEAI